MAIEATKICSKLSINAYPQVNLPKVPHNLQVFTVIFITSMWHHNLTAHTTYTYGTYQLYNVKIMEEYDTLEFLHFKDCYFDLVHTVTTTDIIKYMLYHLFIHIMYDTFYHKAQLLFT